MGARKVEITKSADTAVKQLPKRDRERFARFVVDQLPKFIESHEARSVRGLPGKHWVVNLPGDEGDDHTVVMTDDADHDAVIVTSVLNTPSIEVSSIDDDLLMSDDARVAADVFRSAVNL